MRIYGLQKLSLLDYPEKTAATVFTGGCNMRCPFCHNATLVTNSVQCERIPESEFFDFLEKRRGKLDAVCISGGEPCLQSDLKSFIRRVRNMGFLVKLDTNGGFPDNLEEMIYLGLLDYVAMDFKNVPEKYPLTAGVVKFNFDPIFESINVLKKNKVPYEFRTTMVKGLHDPQDIPRFGKILEGAKRYYIQSFVDSGELIGFGPHIKDQKMESFSKEELLSFVEILKPFVETVGLRGV